MNKEIRNIVEFALGPFIVKNNVTDIDRFMNLLARIICEVDSFSGFKSLNSKTKVSKLLQDALPLLPVLEDAFASLSPSKAMDLLKNRPFFPLWANWNTWNSWLDQHTPFCTYQDLLCLIQKFERYINRHKRSLLTIGYPKASFEVSLWLYYKLARLYPIKLPASIKKEQSHSGNRTEEGHVLRSFKKDCSLTYIWSKEIRYWKDESQIKKRCSYEEAPVFPRLIHKGTEGVERRRSIVLDLKMRILKIASKSLASKSSNGSDHLPFWSQCMDAISEMLPQEDFQLLNSIDEQYSDVAWGCGFEDEDTGYVFSNPITGRSTDMPVGGIKNLLEFVFFIERELTIGRMHNTKTKLLSIVGNGPLRSYWQLTTNKKMSPRIDKLISEFWEYGQHEDRLNQELDERLADLSKKLRIILHVKPEYYDMVKSAAQLIEGANNAGFNLAIGSMKTSLQRPRIVPIQLPPHTRWEDITISFRDAHSVTIKAGDFHRPADYKGMGLENRTRLLPNKQWDFLYKLANNHGELSWHDSKASLKNRKRKELLAKALRTYFQVSEDPFYPYKQQKAYKIRINLIPD